MRRHGTRVGRPKREQTGLDRLPFSVILILLSLLLIFCSVVSYWALFTRSNFRSVPISLHSVLMANYQVDLQGLKLPRIKLSIIQEALADQYGRGSSEGLATLVSEILLPVPTNTPSGNQNNEPTPVSTLHENSGTATLDARVPTSTPNASLATNTPVMTHIPTIIISKSGTPTATQRISLTPTPPWWKITVTITSVISTQPIPTSTPLPSSTSTPLPTSTRVPTRTPSPTPTKIPTNTLISPSSTPRPTNTADPYPGPSPNPTIDPYP